MLQHHTRHLRGVVCAAFVALTLPTLSLLAHPAAAQQPGTIRGAVVASTGDPLSETVIFIEGSDRQFLTNQEGRFAVTGLAPGDYRLVAERMGYGSARATVSVSSGGTTEVTFTLLGQAMRLPEVVVTASREARHLSEVAASVGVIGGEEIRASRPGHPSEIMGQVPGVWVNVTGGEGHMTAIRQPITTDAVYLYLEDGVPTRSTGFFNHNALYEVNLPQADRVEVMKGPANALYGSDAIGGVINVGTRPPSDRTRAELSVEAGSYGFQRYLGSLSGTSGKNGIRVEGNFTTTDGWRDGTGYERYSGTLRWDRELSGSTSLRSVLTASAIDQSTAGSSALARDDYESAPERNYTPISFRKVSAIRASAAFETRANAWTVSVTPFGRLNSMDLMPNWSLTFDPAIWETQNASVGLLAKATYTSRSTRGRVTVGVDADYSPGTHVERSIVPNRVDGIFTEYTDGAPIYDYDVTFKQVSPYLQGEFTPGDRLHLSAGVRADFVGYDYTNHLSVEQTGQHRRPADASPTFQALTPKVGVTFQATERLNLFTSYRRGFRVASEGQLFRQGSAANTIDLEPVKVDAYEAGLRGDAGSRVRFELVGYHMTKRDDILSFRNPDGSTEAMNAGETRHRGIELGFGVSVLPGVTLDAAYTFTDHAYVEWRPNPDLDLGGNTQEFAPRQIGNIRLTVAPATVPLRLTGEWSRVGPYWMDAANTNEYEGHHVLNLQSSYDFTDRLSVFGRLNNVADTRYAERASYTAGRGEELAPGMPRTLYLGLSLR